MTEQDDGVSEEEWLSTDWMKTRCGLVDLLRERAGLPIQQRKWRLFLVACLHRVWHVFKDERCRMLVEAVERRADGVITQEQLDQLELEACNPQNGDIDDPDDCPPERRLAACAVQTLGSATSNTVEFDEAYNAAGWIREATDQPELEDVAQHKLVMEIFGNPFRPVIINPAWLAWNDGTVRKIAQSIYEERAFDRLPILADALTDAGCDHAALLNHCRSEGPHVKGCWVVDLLTGRQ